MCRSIKKLRNPEQTVDLAEVHEAALQYVRKISGYRVPSKANTAAFDQAVNDVAAVSRHLLESLVAGRRAG